MLFGKTWRLAILVLLKKDVWLQPQNFLVYRSSGFEWLPNKVTWYIDGKVVRTHYGGRPPIPDKSAKIMMNLWIFGPKANFGGKEIYNNRYPMTSEYDLCLHEMGWGKLASGFWWWFLLESITGEGFAAFNALKSNTVTNQIYTLICRSRQYHVCISISVTFPFCCIGFPAFFPKMPGLVQILQVGWWEHLSLSRIW